MGAIVRQTSPDSFVHPWVSVRSKTLPTIHIMRNSKQIRSPRCRVGQQLVLARLVLIQLRSGSGAYSCVPRVYAHGKTERGTSAPHPP